MLKQGEKKALEVFHGGMMNNQMLILCIHWDMQFYMLLLALVCSYVFFSNVVAHTNAF